jgi:hypothetical protein
VRQARVGFSGWAVLPALALAYFCRPLREQIVYGQFSALLAALVVGTWAADRSGHPWLAGACLGLASTVKFFPAFLFLYFLLRRRWRVVLSGAATGAALTGLTVAVLGVGAYRDYLEKVLPHLQMYRTHWVNVSVMGFWDKLFVGGQRYTVPLWDSRLVARVGAAVCGLALVGALAPAVVRARSRAARDHAFGASVVAMLLLSPLSWTHYFLLLLPTLLLLYRDLPPAGAPRFLFWPCLVTLWVNITFAWVVFVPALRQQSVWTLRAEPWQTLTGLSLQMYALIGVFVLGLRAARDADLTRRDDPSPPAT